MGNSKFAWSGLINEKKQTPELIHYSGKNDGFINVIKKMLATCNKRTFCPACEVIHQETYYVCNNIRNLKEGGLWKSEAIKRGYLSLITLPVRVNNRIVGVFTLFSADTNFFNEEEIILLEEVANDLGFALGAIKTEKEHEKAITALKEREQTYKILTEGMKDVVWTADPETFQFLYVSPSVEQLRGYTSAEVMANPMDESFTPAQKETLFKNIQKQKAAFISGEITSQNYSTHEVKQPCKDGTFVTTEVVTNFMVNPLTKRIELHGVSRDITERKKAEEAIINAERRSNLLIEKAPDGIVLVNEQGEIKYASPSARRIFGYPQDDSPLPNPNIDTHPEDLPSVLNVLQRITEDPSLVLTHTYRFKTFHGDWRWVESTFSNQLEEPAIQAIIINFRDVTERIETEKTIQNSELRLSRAEIASSSGNWELHLDTRKMIASKGAMKVYGVSKKKWLTKRRSCIHYPNTGNTWTML